MWMDAAMVTLSCVLYVNMGLHDAIVERLGFGLTVTGCVKCCTFWAVLAVSVLRGYPAIQCIAASFLSAYAALWLALLHDALATLYNRLYERITNNAAAEDAPETDERSEAGSDALP